MKPITYKLKPWDHQLKIIENVAGIGTWIDDHLHATFCVAPAPFIEQYALFLEMGTGKTATTLNILRHAYKKEGGLFRTLILCPRAMKVGWQREIEAHTNIPKQYVKVLEGTGKKRIETLKRQVQSGPGIVIANYEVLLNADIFELFKEWGVSGLVVDESHMCKNISSKRTKALIKLSDQIKYKYILTGTPILNSPMDIFSQFRIMDGGDTFGTNFFAFRAKYFYDSNAGMPSNVHFPNWKPRPDLNENFSDLIFKKAVRILKSECLDLPPLVKEERHVELAPDQARMYKAMEKDFVAYLGDRACVATIALTKALRMQQIACGYVVDDEGLVHTFRTNPRLKELGEMIKEIAPEHKIIVWSHFGETYDMLQREIEKNLRKDEYMVRYVGGMSDKEAQNAIDSFQDDPLCRVIQANQKAGGAGITLTSSSVSIYYSKGFALGDDWQSEARNHRGGSEIHEKITRVDIVATDTIDEHITKALADKVTMSEGILNANSKISDKEMFHSLKEKFL